MRPGRPETRPMTESCWFCHDRRVPTRPRAAGSSRTTPGAPAPRPRRTPPPGTVILEARRHVADQAGFDAVERATVAEVTGRLLDAIRTATGCDRVYQWATMDGYPPLPPLAGAVVGAGGVSAGRATWWRRSWSGRRTRRRRVRAAERLRQALVG